MKNKVLLFYPNPFPAFSKGHLAREIKRTCVPLSLLALAGPLIKASYNVEIINEPLERNWKKTLLEALKGDPICVGISAMTGSQITYGLETAKLIKENSRVPVIWGGLHATLLPRQTLENGYVDIVVEGEGEATFLELVETIREQKPLADVRSIWYKEGSEIKETPKRGFIDLNAQPPLPYQLLKKHDIRNISVFTSRGCPNRCRYCYNATVHHRRWRALPAEEALKRIKTVITTYEGRIERFFFIDDDFFTDPQRARRIIEGLVPFGIPWRLQARVDTFLRLEEDFLNLLAKSRCHMLHFGVESGSQRILELIEKNIRVDDVVALNKRLSRYPIVPSYSFMIGFPTETIEDIKMTMGLIKQLLSDNPHAYKNLNIYGPYPGNELFELALAHGFQPPQRLKDWGQLHLKNVNKRPWLGRQRADLLEMLVFCSSFMEKERFSHLRPLKILAQLYRPLAHARLKNLYTGFPVEIKLAKALGFLT